MAVLRAHILLELALVLGLDNFILINYLRFEFHSKDRFTHSAYARKL